MSEQRGRPPHFKVLSVTQAAKAKGCSAGAVRVALQQGRLRGNKTEGGWWLIRPEDLERWEIVGHRPKGWKPRK